MVKRTALICCLAVMAISLAGCARQYRITLTNNQHLIVNEKPKYREDLQGYVYKAGEREEFLPIGRVRAIEPASMNASYAEDFEYR